MEVLYDTPKELIELAKMIDWHRITDQQLKNWANDLRELAQKYNIPMRKPQKNAQYKNISIDGCPQKVGNFISEFDFTHINQALRSVAFQFIKAKLPSIVPVKKNR